MPTPLAHGLAGIATGRTVRIRWKAWQYAVIAFAIALVPDLDFVPGVLLGEPGLFHRGPTHSVAGAILFSVPLAWLLALLTSVPDTGAGSRIERFLRWYAFVLPVYLSHLFLDLLSPDTVHNSGLHLLWPLTDRYVRTPVPVPPAWRAFFDLEFGPDSVGFFRTLFSGHAVAVYFAEALLFSPLFALPVIATALAGARSRSAAEVRGARSDRPDEPGSPDRPERAHSARPGRGWPVRRLHRSVLPR